MRLVGPLVYAMQSHPEKLSGWSLGQLIPDSSYVSRKNDKRPAKLEMFIPDEVAMNILGKESLQDAYIFLRIPREVIQQHDRESKPVIIEPEKGLYLP